MGYKERAHKAELELEEAYNRLDEIKNYINPSSPQWTDEEWFERVDELCHAEIENLNLKRSIDLLRSELVEVRDELYLKDPKSISSETN